MRYTHHEEYLGLREVPHGQPPLPMLIYSTSGGPVGAQMARARPSIGACGPHLCSTCPVTHLADHGIPSHHET